ERRVPCLEATSPPIRTSRNARPTTSRPAMRSAAYRTRKPNGAPGPPSTRTTAAATRAAPDAAGTRVIPPRTRAGARAARPRPAAHGPTVPPRPRRAGRRGAGRPRT
ncbi:hypothetical protein LTR94_028911, partial [Friedmanniomyces endolithicus]